MTERASPLLQLLPASVSSRDGWAEKREPHVRLRAVWLNINSSKAAYMHSLSKTTLHTNTSIKILVMAGLGLALSNATPSVANADVVSDIEEARARCTELYDAAEVANEELNGTQVRLDELNGKIGEIEASIQDDKVLLRENMRLQYKSGRIGGLSALMNSESMEQLIDNAEYVEKMKADNEANIRAVAEATKELKSARNEIQGLRDEQAACKEDLDAKVQEANDYMAGLTQELRDQLGVDNQSAGWGIPDEISSGTGEAWRDVVLTAAYANLGGAYVYGGSAFKACDCSGLVLWCYAKAGVSLSHYSEDQARYCNKSLSQAVPGDIVWRYGHVGIYIGDGRTIEAHSPARGISYGSLYSFAACGSPL